MNHEIIAGVDWASEAKNRALVVLEYERSKQHITVARVDSPLQTTDAIAVCKDSKTAVVAVDIPFAWPRRFTEFVDKWQPKQTMPVDSLPDSREFRYRGTDLIVHTDLRKWPLSVSSDRIALGARVWTEACARNSLGNQIDVSGDGTVTTSPRIIEVYPAATLAAFGQGGIPIEIEGYKQDEEVRRRLVELLCQRFGINFSNGVQMDQLVAIGKDSDKADAFIAALTALIYHLNIPLGQGKHETSKAVSELNRWTIRRPKDEEKKSAVVEGWIFFPVHAGAKRAD